MMKKLIDEQPGVSVLTSLTSSCDGANPQNDEA